MMRMCELCNQVDDHPRMIVLQADGNVVSAHHDCHAEAGNPEAASIVEQVGGAQGSDLRALLQTGEVNVGTVVEGETD